MTPMPDTTPQPRVTDRDLTAVLTQLGESVKKDRHESDGYRIMESARSVDGVIRRLVHATKSGVLDAYDVLTTKFGFEHSRELYDYLHQVPARAHLYEKAFNAETHIGCVDRAMAKVAEEALIAAGRAPEGPRQQGQRIDAAALAPDGNGGIIGNTAAENALILATQADDVNRIQRLSCDVRAITARIGDDHPELDQATLAATVRLVLHTAARIAHEKDGAEA